MIRLLLIASLLFSVAWCYFPEENVASYWDNSNKQELENALNVAKNPNTNIAKNVIIMIGDGMSISTTTAARIMKSEVNGMIGKETNMEWDNFPHAGLSKTYSIDKQVADSASTATAYLCGVKGNHYTLGLTGEAKYNNCNSSLPEETHARSILLESYLAGKSTGIITTTTLNHATPAGSYSHSPNRMWYNDADMTEQDKADGCVDIATEFLDNSHMFTVSLGGGRTHFQPTTTSDPEYPLQNGSRIDGIDLIKRWKEEQREKKIDFEYVWNKEQFDEIDPAQIDTLLGIFEPKNMQYDANRESQDGAGEPSLAEMTKKAIEILQKNEKGYFLLVEGGRIDHGHHFNNAYLALTDAVALDNAVAMANQMTSEEDTLIIVTADHSHTFTMGGYSDRGNPILGLAPSNENPKIALDGSTFTTLGYGNGYKNLENETCDRKNFTGEETVEPDYRQQSIVPLDSETHGGDDVAIMARGPMSHLFHGVHEQSYIAYVMKYASCVGETAGHCAGATSDRIQGTDEAGSFLGQPINAKDAQTTLYVLFVLTICLLLYAVVSSFLLYKHSKKRKIKASPITSEEALPLDDK